MPRCIIAWHHNTLCDTLPTKSDNIEVCLPSLDILLFAGEMDIKNPVGGAVTGRYVHVTKRRHLIHGGMRQLII
jgi:hypothetical protein